MRRSAWSTAFAACGLFASAAVAQVTLNWHGSGGEGIDVGAGGSAVWLVGRNGGAYRLHPTAGWVKMPGIDNGVRVDVDSGGNALVVTAEEKLLRWNGSSWVELPGRIVDVGASAKGNHLWAVGGGNAGGNNRYIFRWEGGGWVVKNGGAVRIDVDSQGQAWVVNAQNQIFRWMNERWVQVQGGARDITVGEDDVVWIAGNDGTPWRFDGQAQWLRGSGSGLASLSADATSVWGIGAGQQAVRGMRLGKVIAIASGHGALRADKLGSIGDVPGAKLVGGNPQQRWVFGAQGTVRLEEDESYCLTQSSGGNPQRLLDSWKCDGTPASVGWSYQPSDQTIRWNGLPAGCMAVSITPPWRGRVQLVEPCPDDPQRSRWVLRD